MCTNNTIHSIWTKSSQPWNTQHTATNMITWFLVHPASKTHWATRFLQLLLSSAASSTSSQLMSIFLRSFLTSFQFCCGRPGLLLKPSGSHVRACRRSLRWPICERCPSHLRRLHLIMSSNFGSAVASLTFSFVTLSFQEIPRITHIVNALQLLLMFLLIWTIWTTECNCLH